MNRAALLASLIIPLALGAVAAPTEDEAPADLGPPIEVEVGSDYTHNLGILTPRQQVHLQFQLNNPTDEDYVIRGMHSSCGCTVPDRNLTLVPAGGSEMLAVDFSAPNRAGSKSSRVSITSEDGSSFTIALRGRVQTLLEPEPAYVNFPSVSVDDEVASLEETVTLTNRSDVAIAITEIRSNDSHIIVPEEIPTVEPQGEVTFSVGLIPPERMLNLSSSIDLETDHPEFQRVNIPVYARVTGTVTINPQRLWYGFLEAGTSRSLELSVQDDQTASFEVTEVILNEPGFTTEITEGDNGVVVVVVTLDTNGRDAGVINADLRLRTNSATTPEVLVDVIGGVRSP